MTTCWRCGKAIDKYDTMVRVRDKHYPPGDEPRYLHMRCFIDHAVNWVFP